MPLATKLSIQFPVAFAITLIVNAQITLNKNFLLFTMTPSNNVTLILRLCQHNY